MASITRGFAISRILLRIKTIDIVCKQNESCRFPYGSPKPLPLVQIHARPTSSLTEDAKEGTEKSRVEAQFNELLNEHKDIESSLKFIASKKSVGINDAIVCVNHIAKLIFEVESPKLSTEDIGNTMRDRRFEKIGNVLHKNIEKVAIPSLLSTVETLLKLSAEDIHLIKSLETQVIWLHKTMPIPSLVKVIQVHKDHMETPLRQNVLQEAMKWIERRWVEISRPKDVLYLMYTCEDQKTEFLSKLEEKALDICEYMSDKELFRTVSLLSKRNCRNMPLLKKISYYLATKELNLDLTQLQNLLFSCVNLRLYNKRLLGNITDSILGNVADLNDPVKASGLLKSFGLLRWDKAELIDALAQVVIAEVGTVNSEALVNLILACGTIDHLPPCVAQNLGDLLERLKGIETDNKRLWLDIVWNCVVLKIATADMIASVLERGFIDSVTDDDSTTSKFALLKLKQIHSSAQHEVKNYDGPCLPDLSDELPLRSKRTFVEKVTAVLSNMAPSEKYLSFDVPTSSGFVIDIELAVDEKLQPVALAEHLTPGINRLAIRVLDFSDLTLASQRPTGHNALAIRLLPHHGYQVLKIPFMEFQKHRTEVQQLQYLQNEIKSRLSPTQSQP